MTRLAKVEILAEQKGLKFEYNGRFYAVGYYKKEGLFNHFIPTYENKDIKKVLEFLKK
jgi:hypothetical protein